MLNKLAAYARKCLFVDTKNLWWFTSILWVVMFPPLIPELLKEVRACLGEKWKEFGACGLLPASRFAFKIHAVIHDSEVSFCTAGSHAEQRSAGPAELSRGPQAFPLLLNAFVDKK